MEATHAFRHKILAEGLDTIFSAQPPTLEQQARWFEKFENDPNSALFVHEEDGEIVGMLGFESFASTAECRHAGSLGLSVLGPHRGKGIGTALLRALFDWAVQHPEVERLELEVLGNNAPAKRLYERQGFEVEGIKKRAVRLSSGYVDSIVMTKWV